jgi:plastocyanin
MEITLGLTALLAVLAMIISVVALAGHSTKVVTVTVPAAAAQTPAASTPTVAPASFTVSVRSDTEHGRKGPDGQWHDAFVPANYTVHAGAKVTFTVYNYDNSPHSFTAPGLGQNQVLPGGSATAPSVTKFTFTAPSTPGKYLWRCTIPCDPWAMMHIGYMRGYVNVVA